jgi:hypothetical protein
MSHTEFDGSAISCSSEHNLGHNSRDVNLILPFQLSCILLRCTLLFIQWSTLPLKVQCDSILFSILLRSTS